MAEVIRLPFNIPGVGMQGDYLVHDPTHPNPELRVAVVSPRAPSALMVARDAVTRPRPARPELPAGSSAVRRHLRPI
jgi:hypothetical protein